MRASLWGERKCCPLKMSQWLCRTSPLDGDPCLTFICRLVFIFQEGSKTDIYIYFKCVCVHVNELPDSPQKLEQVQLLNPRLYFPDTLRLERERKTCPESIKSSSHPKLLFCHDNGGLDPQYVTFASGVLSVKTVEWYSVERIPEARQQPFEAQRPLAAAPNST